ncbi:response regulator [Aureicoccus marinus]|uniref:DNA-binding response regulator n=1 Tax=Aureicoccus marinus TaxID=754435 RepID=A0A2S7T6E2_9FLAO|nr:response regulator transcription factor [Aureicoccus marinus]PQJ15168.1 hypothetical protein BST99_04980 [Aureicoccus marinus]
MNTNPKTVVLCEDHLIVSDGLSSLIHSFKGFQVIKAVSNYKALLDFFSKGLPDILVLDLNLPDKNGMEILREFRENGIEVPTLVLTMYNKSSIIQKSKSLGARGFLLKNCSSEDLEDALNHVVQSEKFYYGEGVRRALENSRGQADDFTKSVQLTPREKEIVICLCEGKKVPDIAEIMNISPLTVETHKKNIYKKLGVDSNVKLVNFAHENQLI